MVSFPVKVEYELHILKTEKQQQVLPQCRREVRQWKAKEEASAAGKLRASAQKTREDVVVLSEHSLKMVSQLRLCFAQLHPSVEQWRAGIQ